MAKKFHVAESGAGAGELTPCTAKINCRLGADNEHFYFANSTQAKECSELLLAQNSGGAFGGGLSEKESQRLSELRATSELNRAKEMPAKPGDLYLEPSTSVERFFHMESRKGSNFESRGSSPGTISKRVTGELESARVGGYLLGASGVATSVRNRKLGKQIAVEITMPGDSRDVDERELMRRASRIAESFTKSSYSLVDSNGYSNRERVSGDQVEINVRYLYGDSQN